MNLITLLPKGTKIRTRVPGVHTWGVVDATVVGQYRDSSDSVTIRVTSPETKRSLVLWTDLESIVEVLLIGRAEAFQDAALDVRTEMRDVLKDAT